jgi:ankyrin repeat protein
MAAHDSLMALVQAICADDSTVLQLLARSPALARERLQAGATRHAAKEYFLASIAHYAYTGDTALHIAAAAYRQEIVQKLIALGADVRAKNRRGAEPLHYAVDGGPGQRCWHPAAQEATVACLLAAGADPNATDVGGVTPLHRAVRNRCAGAVRVLLGSGADAGRKNKRGSTPFALALRATGRGGSGTAAAKAQQEEIVRLLEQHKGA